MNATQELLTSADLNERVQYIVNSMRRIAGELRRSIEVYVDAEEAWELAKAKAYLDAEGSNQKEREARAQLVLSESGAYKTWRVIELTRKAGERELKLAESALSAQQSVAATVRNELRLAGYEPS